MAVKVFLLGRPGSGKSTAARCIKEFAYQQGCPTTHIYDYAILHDWFMSELDNPENDHKYFRPIKLGGFDVIDFSVLRRALEEIEKQAQTYLCSEINLVLIEFARDNYSEVLRAFSDSFLHDAYFLFLETDVETCIERVRERSLHPATPFDHFVSAEIFTTYYHKDNKPYILRKFPHEYNLDNKRVTAIDNVGSQDDFLQQIIEFTSALFEQEPSLSRKTGLLQEVSPTQKPQAHEQKYDPSIPEQAATTL